MSMEVPTYDYAVIRVVPRVEREEFINVGVIVFSRELKFLEAEIVLDPKRMSALMPVEDLEEIQHHLSAITSLCKGGTAAGPIGELSQSERFHWLTSPRSTIVQTSAVHSGVCVDPKKALDHLMKKLVHV